MNEKEVAEIRRRFRPDKSNISNIRGCYVNDNKEIVSEFNQSLSFMPEDESEKFLSILKKTLSGALNKNLIDIEFSTQQVMEGEEHQLLMALRDSALKEEDAVRAFFQRVIQAVTLEENYVILLAYDTHDVAYRSADGERQDDAFSNIFSYILCSICPIKLTKPALSYYVYENEFHSRTADWIVSPPELGFMFPSYDDRSTNLYNALYYTRDITQSHQEFVDSIFNSELPMPAAVQKETFQSVLSSTLAEDCNFEIVHAVHSHLQEMVEEHKVNKEMAPLTVSKSTLKKILAHNGVAQEKIDVFEEQFDTEFGEEANLSPQNIVDTKKIEVATPDVAIHVSPGCSDLLETRVIDGAKYIMIRAEQGVELNGVPIFIS